MHSFLAQGTDTGGSLPGMLVPLVAIFVLMYLLLIRPQRKQEQKRREMIAAVKKNDHILTNGGLLGVVTNVKDDEVTIRIDDARDVKVRIHKNFIASKVSEKEESGE